MRSERADTQLNGLIRIVPAWSVWKQGRFVLIEYKLISKAVKI